jgi:hypothetical protein
MLWYRFNETSGTTAVNYGSLGPTFNGTYFNGVALGVASQAGDTAAGFTGSAQQYVESGATAPASLTGNPSFTAEAVFYVSSSQTNAGYAPFLHWGAPTTGRSVYFSLHHLSNNKAYTGFYNGGLRMVCTFKPNTWNHLVWVRDNAGGASGQWTGTTVYLNGEVVQTERDTVLVGAPVINVTSTTFRVQRATDFTRYFTGRMDEVVLYPHLLTADDVRLRYEALQLTEAPCHADFNDDCSVDFFDYLDFVAALDAEDPAADYNGDNSIDFFDYLDFAAAFDAGC